MVTQSLGVRIATQVCHEVYSLCLTRTAQANKHLLKAYGMQNAMGNSCLERKQKRNETRLCPGLQKESAWCQHRHVNTYITLEKCKGYP